MAIYSHSKIGTFENCPLQYKLNYIDRIKRYTEGIEAFLGSRCHEVLEKLYKDKLKGKTNTLDELLNYFEHIWKKKFHDDIKIVHAEYKPKHYQNIGRRAIKDYYKRYYPFDKSKTLALEKLIYVTLNDNDGKSYKFQGFIDRLAEARDGEYEIHDYKTSGSIPEQTKFDKDRQLALYQIGIQQLWPGCKKVHLIWHYLVFDKEIRSYRTNEELNNLKKKLISTINEIEKATEKGLFEAKESALCNWCNYPDLCPKRKHLYRIENLPKNKYFQEPGIKLVDKYVSLIEKFKEQKGEYEAKKTKIEEALLAFASKNNYDNLVGSNYKVKIKKEEKASFPKAGNPQREELVLLLQQLNIFEKVCALSLSKLTKVMKTDGLTDEQIKRLEKFRAFEEKISFSISKIEEKTTV